MHLVAIAYASTAVRPLDAEQIDALLSEARDHDSRAGVTGALLHHEGAFFQYIEEPPEGVKEVYRRIRASRAGTAASSSSCAPPSTPGSSRSGTWASPVPRRR